MISSGMYVHVPLSNPSTSDAVGLKTGGKLGPITNEGVTVTRSMLFSSQNFHAAFSAIVFDNAYQTCHTFTLSDEIRL